MSRLRGTVKMFMGALSRQRPNLSAKTRKRIKAGIEKFFGKTRRKTT